MEHMSETNESAARAVNPQALESLLRVLLLHTEPCYWPVYFQLRCVEVGIRAQTKGPDHKT